MHPSAEPADVSADTITKGHTGAKRANAAPPTLLGSRPRRNNAVWADRMNRNE
jgi:hypothetical protein